MAKDKNQADIKVQFVPISDVKMNPDNPREISVEKFKKLKKSIEEFPSMLHARPVVVDENMMVLGGNMRYQALRDLGYEEIPVLRADNWTEEQKREFIVKDNLPFGVWDWDALAEQFDMDELTGWGFEEGELVGFSEPDEEEEEQGEYKFSEELDRESNYVVLKFDRDIDFTQIQTLLGLETVYSKRANGKPWSAGIGRVVDGVDAIEAIKTMGNEEKG